MIKYFETILVEREESVGVIRLNRPEALNALNAQMMIEVVEAVGEFDRDRSVGAIVITGSEKAFAAGADIKEMAGLEYVDVYLDDWFTGWDALAKTRTPLIAAVSGYALGGGCEVAMICDVIIASETAKFGQPEIALGVIPGIGGTQRLTRAVGKYLAMDMVLTGRLLSATEARDAGLVSRVVPVGEEKATAMQLAAEISKKSRPVVYAAKEAVNVALESTLAEGVRFERRAIQGTFALDDRVEGMTAFAEKRHPQFRNR